jgi:hypothetical protein
VCQDLDLALGELVDLDVLAEVTGAALELDAVVQELLESLDVEDLVVDGLRAVDDELQDVALARPLRVVEYCACMDRPVRLGIHTRLSTFPPFLPLRALEVFYMVLSLLFYARNIHPSGQQSSVHTGPGAIAIDLRERKEMVILRLGVVVVEWDKCNSEVELSQGIFAMCGGHARLDAGTRRQVFESIDAALIGS